MSTHRHTTSRSVDRPVGPDAEQRSTELAELELAFDRLWPLPRSLTGEGVRRSHDILGEILPLERLEVPSDTKVHDWHVPPEWVVNEAYVLDPLGRRILDFDDNNLHLVGYSVPFRGRLSRDELDAHLFSLPAQPEAIPYVTSYYKARWGFCLSHHDRARLLDGEYEVVVDTLLVPGSMTISECVLPGISASEVLITSYTCHPSLANNEIAGPLVAAFLYRRLVRHQERRLTYRFVFAPETIGAIAYLAIRGDHLKANTVAGYVVTCVGGPDGLTYKRSRDAPTLADRAAEHVLRLVCVDESRPARLLDFVPTGSDERQYGSPGYRLPVGSLMRTMYGTYPEYHTSLDNKDFVELDSVQLTLDAYEQICMVLDGNETFLNLEPYGEPRLAVRGLYPDLTVAGSNVGAADPLFWVLNLSDGRTDLLSVADRSGLPFTKIRRAATVLEQAGLLSRVAS
jgi:aminopeptidase-like protein